MSGIKNYFHLENFPIVVTKIGLWLNDVVNQHSIKLKLNLQREKHSKPTWTVIKGINPNLDLFKKIKDIVINQLEINFLHLFKVMVKKDFKIINQKQTEMI